MADTGKTKRKLRSKKREEIPALKVMQGVELDPTKEAFFRKLLNGEVFEAERFNRLNPELKDGMKRVFSEALNSLAFEDRDRMIEVVDKIMEPSTRRHIWDVNHDRILKVISAYTQDYGQFPSRTDIANNCGLTRVTVDKHLAEYFGSQQHKQKQEDFVVMREKVLARAFHYALNGDMKAAKIFLEATTDQQPVVKNQQNNFIQINGHTITQEQLSQLPQGQQKKIERILQAISPQQAVNTNSNQY